MTYFLDFDRTLFDTSAFIAYLMKRDGREELRALSETDRAKALNAAAAAGTLSFAPGELAQFMYPDAEAFLDMHARESAIVTWGNRALQEAKLENVFSERKDLRRVYTDERKGALIAQLSKEYEKPWIFIDDKIIELDSVAGALPEATLYEMRRDGKPASGAYPVLRSFSELS
ncbi:MAG: hypothetical protein JO026_02370 [Patescibacteria group bacterium]|nr:hypothetical protein [Patescibacteria group bacterium]